MTAQVSVVEPSADLRQEELPPAVTRINNDLKITASINDNQNESSNRDQIKKQPPVLQGSKCRISSRKSQDDHTQRRQEAKTAERSSAVVQRDIISTKSNRDLMRQISSLGMIDPVYGTREASPLHQSIIFDDMSLGDIPDDFKDAVSVASDHTATDGNGFDSTIFSASLQFSADEHDLPSLDGSSVSRNTKKQSLKGNSLENPLIDFDSLLSGNGRSPPSKASNLKAKDSKPPLPDRQNYGARSKPQDISVKPLSLKEAYREIPSNANCLFPKDTIHTSTKAPYPTSLRKAVPSNSQNSKTSPQRKLPSLAQIFPEGRPPRRTKETNTTDLNRKTSVSVSAPKLQTKAKN